jgi:hypothetical protein
MKVSFRRAQSSAKAMSSATKPQPTHTASALASNRAFQLGVVEVDNARCLAERHGFVGLTNEHGPRSASVKGDSRYAATVLGIQFAHRPNQAHRGLTSIDHCDSSGKPDVRWVNHWLSLCVLPAPKTKSVPLFGREWTPEQSAALADLAPA